MNLEQILDEIELPLGSFPFEAVEAAIEQREEVTPELLRILTEVVDDPESFAGDEEYMGHLFAMFLLAQFREPRAYPLVVRFAMLPGDLLEPLGGDFETDGLDRVLASVCGGNLDGIKSIIENERAEEFARWTAIDALVTLVAVGEKRREEITDYLAGLFRGGLERSPTAVWEGLLFAAVDLRASELLGDLEHAFADGLVDESAMSMDEARLSIAKGWDESLAALAGDRNHHLVEDTVKELSDWVCFHPEENQNSPEWSSDDDTFYRPPEFRESIAPIRNPGPKVGRNDPCPCGSGKKYKKCCLP